MTSERRLLRPWGVHCAIVRWFDRSQSQWHTDTGITGCGDALSLPDFDTALTEGPPTCFWCVVGVNMKFA